MTTDAPATAAGLILEVKVEPLVCFAMEQRGIPFIRFAGANFGGQPLCDAALDLELAPGLGDRQTFPLPPLAPGERASRLIDYRLAPGRLRQVVELERGLVTWCVRAAGQVVAGEARPIDILPFNQWPGELGLLPMFVTPNAEPVGRVVQLVRDRLGGGTGDASLEGYQRREPGRVVAMIRALHETIQALGVTYAEAPPSFEYGRGQKVRLADAILRDRMATCLDVSLLFAACLERMGLNPVLVLLDGHALHAVWLVEDRFPELVIEDAARLRNLVKLGHLLALDSSTTVESPPRPLETAAAVANRLLADDGRFDRAIDVGTARRAEIRPLPLREEEAAPAAAVEPLRVPAASPPGAPPVLPPAPPPTRPRPEPPPAAAARRFRVWQERLLDLTLRNRLLNLGREGRGWLPLEVPDLGLFEDVLSTGQALEILPKPEADPRAVFGDQRSDPADLRARLLADLRRGTVHVAAPPAVVSAIGKRLERARRTDLEEGGANSLYAAVGVLRWREPGSDERLRAPLLLYPIELTVDRARGRLQIRRLPEEPIGNPTLVEKLRREHQVELGPLVELEPDERGVDVPLLLQGIRAAIQSKAGWEVLDEACVGQFTFTKLLMWKDLDEHARVLCENEVVRHIAERDSRLAPAGRGFTADEMDRAFAPADLPCVLNADSTQLAAIASALSGRSFVLQGPPGTGKSQTIANLIAAAMAAGKTVLFVSEKMAALEVVHRRLKEVGLEDFCLELHSNKSSKRQVLDSLAAAFHRERRARPVPWSERSAELAEARAALNGYAAAVNRPRASGESFYAHAGRLLALAPEPDLGFAIPDVERWTEDRLRRAREGVTELAAHASRVEPAPQHPWRAARVADWSTQLEDSLRERLAGARANLDEVEARAAALASALGVAAPRATASLRALAVVAEARATGPIAPAAFGPGFPALAARATAHVAAARAHAARRTALAVRWSPGFVSEDLGQLEARFARWAHAFFLLAWLLLWSARRALRRFAVGPMPASSQIGTDLASARSARQEEAALRAEQIRLEAESGGLWARTAPVEALEALVERSSRAHEAAALLARTTPGIAAAVATPVVAPAELAAPGRALCEAVDRLAEDEAALQRDLEVAPGEAWPAPSDATHQDGLRAAVERWRAALGSLRPWCHYRRAAAAVEAAGIGGLARAHLAGEVSADRLPAAFEKTLHARLVASVRDVDPALRSFSGTSHHRLVSRFASLDAAHLELSRDRVVGLLEERLPRAGAAVAESSEPALLGREIQKKTRHLPIRKLLAAIPNLLPRLKPCLLMSPLSVAQYLPAGGRRFDLVVFDEASQIGTHDAIGAIARGDQVIVVGDSRQLPPTAFFTRAGDDADAPQDENDQEELESILDEAVAKGLPQQLLGWHYRSRHHALIEFSNRSYYGDRLHVFPAAARAAADLGVSWHPVPDGVYHGGGAERHARTNPREAEALVRHLLGSLRRHAPGTRTFGVVTFSIAQQALIDELLDAARSAHPEIEAHFAGGEGVFVKNLENVQGDERDEILFSVCYARDAAGKLRLHFGPLSNKGGERRLNVAITRARRQLRVFSTLTHDQIDLTRTSAQGALDLKAFLAFAARGGALEERALAARNAHFPGPFEREIRDAIVAQGLDVHSQVGSGGYRVDLAVVHPEDPGRYLLGVECDGPNYASAKTARDRDRLRRQVLEDLGWSLHRVWSTDWSLDRDAEVARLRQALARAAARKVEDRPGVTPAPRDETPGVPATAPESGGVPATAPESPGVPATAPESGGVPATAPESGGVPATAPGPGGPASPASTYRVTDLPATRTPAELPLAEDGLLARLLLQVVSEEGPVHEDVAVRRVLGAFGMSKLSEKPARRIGEVLATLVGDGRVVERTEFLWPTTLAPGDFRTFRRAADEGTARELRHVPPEEIVNAAAWVLEGNLSLERADLARETARQFGVSRMGKHVVATVEACLDELGRRGVCRVEGSRMVWVGRR